CASPTKRRAPRSSRSTWTRSSRCCRSTATGGATRTASSSPRIRIGKGRELVEGMNRSRADGFETTFVVSTPRAKAWELLRTAVPAAGGPAGPGPGQLWIPAIEGAAEEIEAVAEQQLRARKLTEPCAGTEIVITMEDAATGTRITIVQTGFG